MLIKASSISCIFPSINIHKYTNRDQIINAVLMLNQQQDYENDR